ncbi:MAG: DCC1-like thiol-disulfide oxidoreductase family protein [Deinococcaceae bacterium]
MDTDHFPVLLFDGVCNLCNHTVRFVIRHDRKKDLFFASQQSAYGRSQLEHYGLPSLEGVVWIESTGCYTESDALLRLFRYLGGPWAALQLFKVVPRWARNGLYRWIARRRYRLFGKRESCAVPTPELRARFLEDAPPLSKPALQIN